MTFSNDISFASVTLTATVPDTDVGSGTLGYPPLSEDALEFYYATTQTYDPGPSSPCLCGAFSRIAGAGNGAGFGQYRRRTAGSLVITFAGILQSASSPNGPFVDVPSNPQGTYTIPKDSLSAQQYFRAR